jgi:hypothetical protein
MIARRKFLERAGIWIPAAIAFPAIVRAQSFSNAAKVAGWTAPAAGNAEPESPNTDANLWLWLRPDVGLTFDGSNDVYNDGGSSWSDQSGLAHHFSNLSAHKIGRLASNLNGKDALRFTIAKTSRGNTTSTALSNPSTFYFLIKQAAFTNGKRICISSNLNLGCAIYQDTTSPNVSMYSGNVNPGITGLALNSWHILTALWNGASSKMSVDKGSDATGNAGTTAPTGVSFAADPDGGNQNEFDLAGIIISHAANDATQRLKHVNWLSWYGGLGL